MYGYQGFFLKDSCRGAGQGLGMKVCIDKEEHTIMSEPRNKQRLVVV